MTADPVALRHAIAAAVAALPADALLLSGGVDSSTLLAEAPEAGTAPRLAITVGLETSVCPTHGPDIAVPCNSDIDHAREVAAWLGAVWQPIRLPVDHALAALLDLCLALRSYDLGHLNDIPLWVGANEAARIGVGRVWTGDDADSLFGGYRMQRDTDDWGAWVRERVRTIRPPFTDIAAHAGITPVYPWLAPAVVAFAASYHYEDVFRDVPAAERPLPPSFMDQFDPAVSGAAARTWGKAPVRDVAAMTLPDDIAWRPKTDLQFGSGMCALEAPLASGVTPDDRAMLEASGMRFWNDAHRGLYLRWVAAGGTIAPLKSGEYRCAGCGGGVKTGRRHCPTCGAWPADG